MKRCFLALIVSVVTLGAEPAQANPPRPGFSEVSTAAADLAQTSGAEVLDMVSLPPTPAADAAGEEATDNSGAVVHATGSEAPSSPEPQTASESAQTVTEPRPEAGNSAAEPPIQEANGEPSSDLSAPEPEVVEESSPEETTEPEVASSTPIADPAAEGSHDPAGEAAVIESGSVPDTGSSLPPASQSAAVVGGQDSSAESSEPVQSTVVAPSEGGGGFSKLVESQAGAAVPETAGAPGPASGLPDTSPTSGDSDVAGGGEPGSDVLTSPLKGDGEPAEFHRKPWAKSPPTYRPGCSYDDTVLGPNNGVAAAQFIGVKANRDGAGAASESSLGTAQHRGTSRTTPAPTRTSRPSALSQPRTRADEGVTLTRKRAGVSTQQRLRSASLEPGRPLGMTVVLALVIALLSVPLLVSLAARAWLSGEGAAPPRGRPEEGGSVRRKRGGIRYRE